MVQEFLYNPVPPWVVLEPITAKDENWIPAALYTRERVNIRSLIVVRVLRGSKMQSYEAMMNELSAALQFDQPFGENWSAVDDCLTFLYEWMPGDTYILFVRDAQDVLCNEDPKDLENFLKRLNVAGENWSNPIMDNGQYNRPSVPFHTVMKYPKDQEQAVFQRYKNFSKYFVWSELSSVNDG